mgnify:CR=1 FL=1
MEGYGQIILLIILVAISGFFSAAETALTAFRKVKLKEVEKDNPRAASLLKIWLKRPNEILAALLLGNNVVNIFATAIATLLITGLVKSYMNPDIAPYFVTLVMTTAILIFGEITPKIIAKNYSDLLSKFVIHPVYYFSIIMYPIIWIFIFISRMLARIFGIKITDEKIMITEEEIKSIVSFGEEEGIIEQEEKEMIHSIFEIGNVYVREVMVPRIDVFAIDASKSVDEVWDDIVKTGYSRIPIYEESIDHITGIVYLKDLLSIVKERRTAEPIGNFIREAYFVPETKLIVPLLKEFKEKHIHMAVILDEYGGTFGILTIEDILEEIVGDINDEHDQEEVEVEKMEKNLFRVSGKTSIQEVNSKLETEFPESEEYDTFGGFIYYTLAKVPEIGDIIDDEKYKIVVENIENHRINSVTVEIKGENEENDQKKA